MTILENIKDTIKSVYLVRMLNEWGICFFQLLMNVLEL